MELLWRSVWGVEFRASEIGGVAAAIRTATVKEQSVSSSAAGSVCLCEKPAIEKGIVRRRGEDGERLGDGRWATKMRALRPAWFVLLM